MNLHNNVGKAAKLTLTLKLKCEIFDKIEAANKRLGCLSKYPRVTTAPLYSKTFVA